MIQEEPERYRFAQFEFVAGTGELYRLGHRLRLSDQQGRLLLALLTRHGQVISREEIRAVLWPGGEHLDYDHAIRNAINQLRDILRDTPRKPTYIETLPKRGYRFVAPVTPVGPERPATASAPAAPSERDAAMVPTAAETAAGPTGWRRLVPPIRYRYAAAALVVVVAVIGWRTRWFGLRAAQPSRGVIVIGIAPLEASGPQAQQLAEPFRAELMDAVAQLPRLEVRATHSFPPAGSLGDLRELARRLQLDALLLGKIETSDGVHFQLNFELIRGSDAVHLASFQLQGTAGQLSTLRDQLQRDLFYRLSSNAGQSLRPVRSTDNPLAYTAYLRGRALLMRHDDASIEQATAAFNEAVKADPEFAQAYAGLGSASILVGEHRAAERARAYATARDYANRAIALNPDLGEAHATLGFLAFRNDWNAAAAESELTRAIALEPNQAMHRLLYALLLCNTGRSDEALEQIARAHAADPAWPPIFITEMYVAAAARQNDRAIDAAHELIRLMPDWPLAYDQSGWAYWYAGRHKDAVQQWIQMAQLEHDNGRIALEQKGLALLAAQGDAAYARLKLAAIHSAAAATHPNDFQAAEWQINAGNLDEALASMRQMVREHDPEALQFGASPAYARLRGKPEFEALLHQVGWASPSR